MTIDASDYYLSLSNTETVTVTLKRSGSTTEVLNVAGALKGSLTRPRDQYGESIAISPSLQRWTIPVQTFTEQAGDSTAEIRVSDLITDANGDGWIVKNAECICYRSRWVLETVKEAS